MAAASGATQSKYVARRETPVFIAENCTQCMQCITACPDTAMPNTAQEISTILSTAITNYVADKNMQNNLIKKLKIIENNCRLTMNESVLNRTKKPFNEILEEELSQLENIDLQAKNELVEIIKKLP